MRTNIKASQITRMNNHNILQSIQNHNILNTIKQPRQTRRQTEAEILGMSDQDYKRAVLMTLSAINLVLASRQ
jgi:hypothetical protein